MIACGVFNFDNPDIRVEIPFPAEPRINLCIVCTQDQFEHPTVFAIQLDRQFRLRGRGIQADTAASHDDFDKDRSGFSSATSDEIAEGPVQPTLSEIGLNP